MITSDVHSGRDVIITRPELANLHGGAVGDNCLIASFVEIQRGLVSGKNVKVDAFVIIPTGVTIEHWRVHRSHVCFTKDRFPRAVDERRELVDAGAWLSPPR